jgi:TolB-like protein/tetratricopeptide (TPR) repeat protein
MKPDRLFRELQRRHVLRVVGAYAFVAWLVVEAYTTIQPILWPSLEWTNRVVVILALAGLPVAFVLAWVFDITPHGVRRTAALDEAALDEVAHGAGAPGAEAAAAPSTGRRALTPRAAGYFGFGILFALVSFAAYAGYRHDDDGPRARAADAPIQSIAVLPFVDMSSARDQEYFSDGITEELLNRLAQVPDLHVAARTSSFVFKGRHDDVREIGRRLGVQAVVEGSVRREADRLRVATKLIDVATGYQIWSDTFEGDATDVFGIQDRISLAIVDALRRRFAAAPEAGSRGTSSVRAYELYLLGLRRWNQRTDRDLRQALVYFGDAVAEDPAFALAHAGLAQTYAVLPLYGAFPVDSAVLRGSAAVAQALAYDASLAEAYAAMGQLVQNFEWDLRGAEGYYRRALNYQPGYATAHQWYAETLVLLGRHDEAAHHAARARAADPLSPTALYVDAFVKTAGGRTDEGLLAWRELARLHPDYAMGHLAGAYAFVAAGHRGDAAAALDRLAQLLPERAPLYGALASALRYPASIAAARAALAGSSGLPATERAAWHLSLGERAAALAAVQQGFRDHSDTSLPFLLVHPLLGPLLDEPQFRDIRERLELGVGR